MYLATVHSFYVAGGVLAAWAVLVSLIGVTSPNFPGSKATARVVSAISVLLVVAAIATAIYDASTESEDGEGAPDSAAFILPF